MEGNLPEPRDRLDQPIFSAIDSKNLKQALKLVDKRLGKKPTDEFLQVCVLALPLPYWLTFHSPRFHTLPNGMAEGVH